MKKAAILLSILLLASCATTEKRNPSQVTTGQVGVAAAVCKGFTLALGQVLKDSSYDVIVDKTCIQNEAHWGFGLSGLSEDYIMQSDDFLNYKAVLDHAITERLRCQKISKEDLARLSDDTLPLIKNSDRKSAIESIKNILLTSSTQCN